MNTGSIVKTWIWQKSTGGGSNPYTATPKTIGFTKKVILLLTEELSLTKTM
ncbi:hypothetical protein [Flavobacterium sp. SLB02]|uniref:hypothetical protein n=1 Tax=Flavobacterium sp. SLB02 TaxID=2665645 RepID=UPI001E5D2F8D|nr:hypothetical protein [Flavobacterium sp. SLB02]